MTNIKSIRRGATARLTDGRVGAVCSRKGTAVWVKIDGTAYLIDVTEIAEVWGGTPKGQGL